MSQLFRSALAGGAVLCVVVACGEPSVFRARRSGAWVAFDRVEATRTVATPLTLSVCGENDLYPGRSDDETRLCLHLALDAAQLDAAALETPLAIAGEVEVSAEGVPNFAGEPTHAAAVQAAWATSVCFAAMRDAAVAQHVRGQLVLTRREPTRLMGRVSLTLEGALASADCGLDGPTELDLSFDVQR
jgi:hypothetical protein